MKNYLTVFIVFCTLLAIGGCGKEQNGAITGSGTLEATEILVSAKSAGTVTAMLVREGDAVSAGQLIAAIDSEKVVLQKKQALAAMQELRLNRINAVRLTRTGKENLDNLGKKHARVSALLEDGSATQRQFDDLDTALKAAEAQYGNGQTTLAALDAKDAQLSAQLEIIDSLIRDARVLAPISGVVIDAYLDAGELARPAAPVVTIADLEKMRIRICSTAADRTPTSDNGRTLLALLPLRPGHVVDATDAGHLGVDEVRGRLRQASGIARRAQSPPFARKGDQEVMTTLRAAGAGEAIGQDAALEIIALRNSLLAPP